MRIAQRLGILVAVPMCAVSGFGALALTASASEAVSAGRLSALLTASDAAGRLISRLQAERTGVALYLTPVTGTSQRAHLQSLALQTDVATADYRALVAALSAVPAPTTDLLDHIDTELSALPVLRGRIVSDSTAAPAPALSAVMFQYRIVIADLLAFQDDIAQAGSAPPYVAVAMSAASALAHACEYSGLEEVTVLRVANGTPLTTLAQQDITVDRTGYNEAMESFAAVAAPTWTEVPDQTLRGPEAMRALFSENTIAQTPVGTRLTVNQQQWNVSMADRISRLEGVEQGIDAATRTTVARLRDHQRGLAGIEAASIAGTILLAVLVSLRLGRPMIKGLRQLRDGAHAVAYEHLPAAVESLRVGAATAGLSPEDFAARQVGGEAIPAAGDDEIAAVARAFNAVHHEAVRTAAEQALLRAGVGAAFVALARRGERLTGALTSELDHAERHEQDPDRLARLFVLDHLAARMSRNNESLLVLGGEGAARVRDQGVPLIDVVRGALGRIERYSRVDAANIAADVVIAPGAVDHLVHLCAELLDNATTFSAPETRVTVEASVLADRLIVQIADRGIGLAAGHREELNSRLASPRDVDISAVRAMGLTVAALLSSWYGISVELRQRPGGGTIAEMTLPTSLYRAPNLGPMPDAADAADATVPGPVNPSPLYPDPVFMEPAFPESAHPGPTFPGPAYAAPTLPTPAYAAPTFPAPTFPAPTFPAPTFPAPAHAAPGPAPAPSQQRVGEPPQRARTAGSPTEPVGRARPYEGSATTLHGLPKRVPLARLPTEAMEQAPDEPSSMVRDPSRVSASMAAYARGIRRADIGSAFEFAREPLDDEHR